MKRTALLLSSLLAAMLAVPAQADDYGRGGMMRGEAMGMQGGCMMDMQGMHGDCPMMGTHSMTGTVSGINHAKGTLTLKHSAADMTLHFPPAAIKDLKNGDTITVNLGFSRGGPAK